MDRPEQRPLGVKQLFGPGASRLPTIQRRDAIRTAGIARQTTSRELLVNKNRNIVVSPNPIDKSTEERRPVVDETEKKEQLVRRLEEFKLKRAKVRMEQVKNRRKPFVVGIAPIPATPSPLPPRTPNSKAVTPKSIQKGQTPAPLRRVAAPGNSNLPTFGGRQRFKGNIATRTRRQLEVPVPNMSSSPKKKKEEEGHKVEDDDAERNNPFEVKQSCSNGEEAPKVIKVENDADAADHDRTFDIINLSPKAPKDADSSGGKIEVEAVVSHSAPETDNEEVGPISLEKAESAGISAEISVQRSQATGQSDGLSKPGSSWYPDAVSAPMVESPKRPRKKWFPDIGEHSGAVPAPTADNPQKSGRKKWFDGLNPNFLFAMPLPLEQQVDQITKERQNTMTFKLGFNRADISGGAECEQEPILRGDGLNQKADLQESQDVNSTTHMVESEPAESNEPGEANAAPDNGITGDNAPLNLRRSTRSTRFFGSFAGATPRRQSFGKKVAKKTPAKLQGAVLNKTVEDEGIMEVSMPVLATMDSPDNSLIDDLANLNLLSTATDGDVSAVSAALSGLTDLNDTFATANVEFGASPPLNTPISSVAGASSDVTVTPTFAMVDGSSPPFSTPTALFASTTVGATPKSILRKKRGISTQKKVRFRNVTLTPTSQSGSPSGTGTPATAVVNSYVRRQSTYPQGHTDDLINW